MATQAQDGNSGTIPVVRPASATDYSGTTTPAMSTNVIRLVSIAGGKYGIGAGATATVELPAGVVEYVRVNIGDTIIVSGTFNISEVS
jgi:hypothetical protein